VFWPVFWPVFCIVDLEFLLLSLPRREGLAPVLNPAPKAREGLAPVLNPTPKPREGLAPVLNPAPKPYPLGLGFSPGSVFRV
jgi:hypothetical protein